MRYFSRNATLVTSLGGIENGTESPFETGNTGIYQYHFFGVYAVALLLTMLSFMLQMMPTVVPIQVEQALPAHHLDEVPD